MLNNRNSIAIAMLFLLLFISACIQPKQEEQKRDLWQDLNIEFLKEPKTLELTIKEKKEVLAKLSSIKEELKGIENTEFRRLNAAFADFLEKKIEVFESKDAYFLFKTLPEQDFNKLLASDCNKLLRLKHLALELEELLDQAKKINLMLKSSEKFSAEQARFELDEQGLALAKKKAQAALLFGKLCSFNAAVRELLSSISIENACESLDMLQDKISDANKLVRSAKEILEEAAALDIATKEISESYGNIRTAFNELERFYRDLNSACNQAEEK